MFFKNFPIEEVKVLKDEVNQREGESIIMPANIMHAVYAKSDFKMMLIVSFMGSKK